MSEKLQAAILAFASSLLPFLVIIGIISWNADQISAAMLVTANGLTLVGLVWAQGRTKQIHDYLEAEAKNGKGQDGGNPGGNPGG